jgi:glutamine amidotransferase
MVHPIIDEYYNYNPYHHRSSKFVQDKGLCTNEKQTNGTATSPSPSATPYLAIPAHKQPLSPTNRDLHTSIASTLVPSSRSQSPLANGSNGSSVSDLRNLSAVQTNFQKEAKPQELGNTKEKRAPTREEVQELERALAQANVVEPETRVAYGDPMKIAQYFPELNR